MLLPSDCINENALYTVHYAIKLTLLLFSYALGTCDDVVNVCMKPTHKTIYSIKFYIIYSSSGTKTQSHRAVFCCKFSSSSSITVGIIFFFLPLSARFFCILLLFSIRPYRWKFNCDVNANFIWYMFTIRNEIKTLKQ